MDRLAPSFRSRGEEFRAIYLQGINRWDALTQDMGVKLKGAFATREGIEAPHSFTYVQRRSAEPAQQSSVYAVSFSSSPCQREL